ncbi:hypothetical protein [Aquifex sp.]
MGIIKTLIFLAFLIFAIAFTYYNLQTAEVNFYEYSFKIPVFILVFASFGLGLLFPVFYYTLRENALRKREEQVYTFLSLFWRNYLGKALPIFRKYLFREEFVPFYIKIKKEFKEAPDIRLDLYRKGIVETALAEEKIPKDMDGARILLENALGKNYRNLKAKRLLRSIYLLKKNLDKAEELQREILVEIEDERRPHEQRALSTVLAEKYLEEKDSLYLKELWQLPISKLSGAVLASVEGAESIFEAANNLGILNEVIKIMEEKNLLDVNLLSLIENYRARIYDDVLYYVYQRINMQEQANNLNLKHPELKLVKGKGRKFLSLVRIWVCEDCGKEFKSFSSVCPNCLAINSFKINLN